MSIFIESRTSAGTQTIPVESRLLTNRIVFIQGDITDQTANECTQSLLFLALEDKKKPITILINTNGGSITAGMLIYDTIQTLGVPIRTVCWGKSYSMGAIILAAGTAGRYILPNSEVMIHEPLISNGVGGSASSVCSMTEKLLETKKKMNRILAKHSKLSVEEVEKETRYDHYLTAEEALQLGFVDEICEVGMLLKEEEVGF